MTRIVMMQTCHYIHMSRTSLLKDCQGPNSDLFCVGGSRQQHPDHIFCCGIIFFGMVGSQDKMKQNSKAFFKIQKIDILGPFFHFSPLYLCIVFFFNIFFFQFRRFQGHFSIFYISFLILQVTIFDMGTNQFCLKGSYDTRKKFLNNLEN